MDSKEQTTTSTKSSDELLADLLLHHRWNRSYQEASIARVLVALVNNSFFKEIEEEEETTYNYLFKRTYQQWRVTNSSSSDEVLQSCLSILKEQGYKHLYNNFVLLSSQEVPTKILDWAYGTKGLTPGKEHLINAIHKIGTHVLVERADGYFQHDSYVFQTLDEALIRSICVKYDGYNTQADDYICAMLRMKSAGKT